MDDSLNDRNVIMNDEILALQIKPEDIQKVYFCIVIAYHRY